MTTFNPTNVAQGDAHVELQAAVIHGNINYQLPPDPTPEQQFHAGVKYLEARVRDEAQRLIEQAASRGYLTTEVQFHRLIALLSGRTLRQLGSDELDHLNAICTSLPRLDDRDEWAAGLKVIVRLLIPVSSAEKELVLKQIDTLKRCQRDWIHGHLDALLEGAMQDELWQRSVAEAQARRTAGERSDRVWRFFQPEPALPLPRPVRPPSVLLWDWLRLGGAAVFVLAVGQLAVLVATGGQAGPVLGLLAALSGLTAFCVGGADRHFRLTRLREKDARLLPLSWWPEASPDSFTRKVDRLFDRYFGRYVPSGTERSYWLSWTTGIRRQLRDEVVEIYREQSPKVEQVAWLVRYLVSDVRKRWEHGTIAAHRQQLRVPGRTKALYFGGMALLAAGCFWALPAAVRTAPLSGTVWFLLAVAAAVLTVPPVFRIVAERRRVAADETELADQQMARQEAYDRWRQKLASKPSDQEMADWLECDRKVLVDQAMRQYRLRPSQVIAHAFIEAPARSCKRARYRDGPWRYSDYRLLLFLLTEDGVRQVDLELDFEQITHRTLQRLNYRFDAVAAVRIDGIATRRPIFELTLFNGEPISVRVTESDTEELPHGEDPTRITELSMDASGLSHTLHVLEGIAAEGKEWVRHRRQRADDRLTNLAGTLRGLID